jgi:hypothetical protein
MIRLSSMLLFRNWKSEKWKLLTKAADDANILISPPENFWRGGGREGKF